MTKRSKPALAAILLVALAGAPAGALKLHRGGVMPQGEWGKQITYADRERLRMWRHAWLDGLAEARAEGYGATIDRAGSLLDPDAASEAVDIPDGDYRCRTIKLGRKIGLGRAYKEAPAVPCRLGGGHFALLAGIQRPIGQIWPYDQTRLIFLGATMLGEESFTIPYGRDGERDTLGLLDRIGKARWRLVLPQPAWEARVAVIEITPAG